MDTQDQALTSCETPHQNVSTMTVPDSNSSVEFVLCNGTHQTPQNAPTGPSRHHSAQTTFDRSAGSGQRPTPTSSYKNSLQLPVLVNSSSVLVNNLPLLSEACNSAPQPHGCNSQPKVALTPTQCSDGDRNQSSLEELRQSNMVGKSLKNPANGLGRNDFASTSGSLTLLNGCHVQPTIVDLPAELLFNIVQRLPTVSLIACATAHRVFADMISNTQFLNIHTRHVLGFLDNQKDISYDVVPAPVAPLQNAWFEEYLYRAAPYMIGLVRPGVIFYDLLCFKHLFDTWLLQGLGYKYHMFISDVLQTSHPPPLSFITCKRLIMIPKHALHALIKVVLCQPEILLLTVNNFEELSICCGPPSDLDDVWEHAVPSEWRQMSDVQHSCEVVSRQRGLALASFFITCTAHSVICWCGVIDYSTFRWRDTWGLGKFSPDTPLSNMRQLCHDLFQRFIHHLGNEYISVHCTNAFLFRGICKMIQQRQFLMPDLQNMLEKTAATIKRKLQHILSPEECTEVRCFLDSVQFVGSEEAPMTTSGNQGKPPLRELSKTFEVAVQRHLHRYLNQIIGQQVLQLYQDPTCHHILCLTCRNASSISPKYFCPFSDRVRPQRIPFKIWPPHLMHCALRILPALAKFVRLDVELWKRGLLDERLSHKVEEFVKQVLGAVYLDVHLDPSRSGVIARRLLM